MNVRYVADRAPPAYGTAALNVPSPFPRRTSMVPPWLATARSILPSPLQSPATMDSGSAATLYDVGEPNVPLPLPSSTEIVRFVRFPTAISGLPSPLKSALYIATGVAPALMGGPTVNVPSPFPRRI